MFGFTHSLGSGIAMLKGRHAAKRHLDLRRQGPSEHMTPAGRGVLPFRVIVGFPAHSFAMDMQV